MQTVTTNIILTVHYTAGGETVSEEIELTITDRAAVTASSTTGTSSLTVTEAETVSFHCCWTNKAR